MGRKIKSVAMLLVVMILIYYQQVPVIYAEGEGAQDEFQEGEEATEEDTGEDIGEDTEKDSEQEPEQEPEEGPVIERYQLNYPQADGRGGYYVTAPEIEIIHMGEAGTTIYQLHNEEMTLAEGRLSAEDNTVKISGDQLAEGINILAVHMEDEAGVRVEEYDSTTEIRLDTQEPQLKMTASEGFDTWYQKEAWISAAADDGAAGSQIDSISCCCGNKIIGTVNEPEAQFLITQTSDSGNGVNVTVTVVDKAGNKSEVTKKLYIDNSAPKMSLEGITDYMITSQPVTVTCRATEDNGLKECTAETLWQDTQGVSHNLSSGEWREEGKGRMMTQVLADDGIYQLKASACDFASFRDEISAQIIIDSQNPVIQYVDELHGKYMKQFLWNYPKETFIKDFTTFVHQILLDGRLYPIGAEITSEGRHVLRVEAVDSAGNEAQAEAEFVIDRTPPEVVFEDIEEGRSYEEKRTFKAALKNQEDTIEEVRINGVSQKLHGDKSAYQFTVQGSDDYEVIVKAQDKAGNKVVEEIMFQIVPKETTLQKVVKPMTTAFRGSLEKEAENVQEKKPGNTLSAVITVAAVLALGGITGVVWWRKKRN